MSEQDLTLCPQCGGPIQLTASVWLTMDGDNFVPGFDKEFTSEGSKFYCSNDHQLDDWAAHNGLYDRLRDWIEPRLSAPDQGVPCPPST